MHVYRAEPVLTGNICIEQSPALQTVPRSKQFHTYMYRYTTQGMGRNENMITCITITIRAFRRRFYPKRLTSVDTHIDIPTAESTMYFIEPVICRYCMAEKVEWLCL